MSSDPTEWIPPTWPIPDRRMPTAAQFIHRESCPLAILKDAALDAVLGMLRSSLSRINLPLSVGTYREHQQLVLFLQSHKYVICELGVGDVDPYLTIHRPRAADDDG